MDASSLHKLIDTLPTELQKEVYNFATFLLEKRQSQPLQKPRVAGLHAGQTWVSDDFDEPLPDEFWLGENA
jgi:Protein of unknown function (DUF2281)